MKRREMGAANAAGSAAKPYFKGETYNMTEPWQDQLGQVFLDMGSAVRLDGRKNAGPAPQNKAMAAAPENKVLDGPRENRLSVGLDAALVTESGSQAPPAHGDPADDDKPEWHSVDNVEPRHVGHGKWALYIGDDRADDQLFDSREEAEAAAGFAAA